MFNQGKENLVFFILFGCVMIFLLLTILTLIIYIYQKRRQVHFKDIEELKLAYENDILRSQVEIQEKTFQNISREIHDNIGQKLSLAKLYLNTFPSDPNSESNIKIKEITKVIGDAISDLSDLRRSMSSEVIKNNGFVKALEFEINLLNKPDLFNIKLAIIGDSVYMNADKELILFRIVQEGLSNIIKHAQASLIQISLHFTDHLLVVELNDNGKGFIVDQVVRPNGLMNMKKRTAMLNGQFDLQSAPGKGTALNIKIPLYEIK
jgi:hypothetical protein